jgi:hypothetical protein
MALSQTAIDVGALPELAQLAEEVRRTRRPRVLRRDGQDIAMIVPAAPSASRSVRKPLSRRYPTIASLAGAAGSLATPMSWGEVQRAVREERATLYRDKR